MTNLTELWNKGKLPEGDYYIKRRNGYLPYDNIDSHGIWRNTIDEDIIEVLAEVPTYEEYWHMISCLNDQTEILNENAKLKELLKDCKDIFDECFSPSVKYGKLYKKIDEVLK